MTELIVIEELNPLEVFTQNGYDDLIGKIEAECNNFTADITTKAGRDEIASMAYKIAKSKTALDKLGKDLVSDWKAKSKAVDEVRRKAWDRLEALQHKVRQPLTDFENAEKDRVANLEARLADLKEVGIFYDNASQEQIQEAILKANALYQYDWQEFQSKADFIFENLKPSLDAKLAERIKYDNEQIELERLRKEAAEREVREREERIAKEAAEKARIETEQRVEAEKKAAIEEAERAKLAQQEAERRAKELEEKAKLDAERKIQEEKARIETLEKEKAERTKEPVSKLMATIHAWSDDNNLLLTNLQMADLANRINKLNEGK